MPTAAQDLNAKLRLERKFRPVIDEYNTRVVREFRSVYASTGDELNMNAFNDELSQILSNHWADTGEVFSDRIGPELPADVAKTEDEQTTITNALLLWSLLQVPQHAREINSTTQDNITASVIEAEEDEITRELTGVERRRTTATLAANNLNRKLRGRTTGIVMTETQIPAETAKATEAEVLMGVPPRISGGSRQEVDLIKEWVSVGDSLVREAHLSADGQERNENEPFDVGVEQLRYPGDDSLGASAGNIINCRCSAQYNEQQVAESRRMAA